MATVQFPDNSKGFSKDLLPPDTNMEKDYHACYDKPALEKREKKKGDGYFAMACNDIWSYLINDVIKPMSKDLISTIAKRTVDMALYGKPTADLKKKGDDTYVSYNSMYNYRDDSSRSRDSSGNRNRIEDDPNFIKFRDRSEAEDCLMDCKDIVRSRGEISCAKVFSMQRLPFNHTSENWGWYSLSDAEVVPYRGGYRIEFPAMRSLRR